ARGVPHKLTEQWDRRYSFCCSTEGCRLRHTPVSVRFLGRKVYAGVFVVLISALMNGPNKRRACELHRELGLDVRTLKRWHQWWQKEFVSTPFWRLERSGFMPPVDESQLPDSLLHRFGFTVCGTSAAAPPARLLTRSTLGRYPVVQPHSLSRLAALRIALSLRCQLVKERRQALPCRIGMPLLVAEVQVVPKPFPEVCLFTRRHVGAVELLLASYLRHSP
ncbi:MAG: hypothetical protein PHC78_01675, partial [Verrucomicrobiota bacterium]|nr:hypothetical protein [Verrucomicrobiota bacterium]